MLKWKDGDYVSAENGGLNRVSGAQGTVQRILYRLTAHRGAFPFLPEFGSRLWQLGRVASSERAAAAKQYVAEALSDETECSVADVTLSGEEVTVLLNCGGENLSVTLTVTG